MANNFASFLDLLHDVDVAGVTRLESSPDYLTTDELPVIFPMFPEATYSPRCAGDTDLNNFTGDLLLLFSRAEQGTPEADYATLATLADAAHTALLATQTSYPAFQMTWNLATGRNFRVGTSGDFHAIVATVTAEV